MNWLTVSFVRILEAIFVIGILGSALVLILTTIEDIRELFEPESKAPVAGPGRKGKS